MDQRRIHVSLKMEEGKMQKYLLAMIDEICKNWVSDANKMIRAARHLESAAQNYIQKSKMIKVGWAAGAGGGGFLYTWLTEQTNPEDVKNFLSSNPEFSKMTCHTISIPITSPFTLDTIE
uniref:Uncharacterized protein n=2 Tax=Caenorhabditis japonica TaxID=281687 RepID=A0A8R1ECV9_CAEJA